MVDHCTLAVTAVLTPALLPENQYAYTGGNLQLTRRITKQINIMVECFTTVVTGSGCADAVLDTALNALTLTTVRDALIAAGLGLFNFSPVLNVSDLLQVKYEGHAQFELQFHALDDVTEFINWVDEIQGTGTIQPGSVAVPFDARSS